MAEWNPLDNPEEVSGVSGEYFIKTRAEQVRKAEALKRKQAEEREKLKLAEAEQKAKAEIKQQKRKAQTINPLAEAGKAIKEFVAPVDQALAKLDEAVFSPEELKRRRQKVQEVNAGERSIFDRREAIPQAEKESFKQGQEQLRKDMEAPLDVLRTPIKGIVAGVEGVLDIATQGVMDLTINQGKSDDEYVRAAWDFGVTPKTELGKTAANFLALAITTRAVGKRLGSIGKIGTTPVPKDLKGAQWWAAKGKRILTDGLIPGAIADFILTDPEDGNLSYRVQQLVPEEMRDHFMFALAADPDDKPFKNRIKSMTEGAPLNALGNGILALISARKIAQAVFKRGGSKEEAIAKAVDTFTKETDNAAKESTQAAEVERVRWTDANDAELTQVLAKKADLYEQIAKVDPEEATRLEDQIKDLEIRQKELESNFYESADPNVKKEYWETQAKNTATEDPNEMIADAIKAQDLDGGGGMISKAARGKSPFTDAQMRILNLEDGHKFVIDKFKRRIDFDDIARRTGRTVDEVRAAQGKILDDIYDSIRDFDTILSEDELLNLIDKAGGVLKEPRGKFATSEGAGAIAGLVKELSDDIYEIAYSGETLDYSGIGGANNFDRLIDRFVGLMKIYKESAAYHGSGLNSFKVRLQALASGQSPESYLRSMEEEDTRTVGSMLKWADRIKTMARKGDPEAQDEMRNLVRAMILAGGDPAKTVKYFGAVASIAQKAADNIFYNNVLSGVKTTIRNLSGLHRIILDPAAISIRGLVKGNEAEVRAGLAGLAAIKGSLGEAWKVAKITWDSRTPATRTANALLTSAELKAQIELIDRMAQTETEKIAAGTVKGLVRFSEFVDAPGRFLSSQDDFIRTIVARQRIAEMATHKAYLEATDPSDQKQFIANYLKTYSEYIDPQTGQIRDKGLAMYAEFATFQNDPGATINAFSRFIEGVPFGKQLIPFVRTPANIMKYRLEYLPLTNKFSKRYAEAVTNGDALTVAELEGRQMIGSMLLAAGAFMGVSGGMTGNLPSDPAERKRWQDAGIQPRSFNFPGGIQVSYAALEPLSDILAFAADLGSLLGYGITEQPGGADLWERFASTLVTGIAASFTEKAYFANFEVLSELINIQELSPKTAEKLIASYAYNQAVPYASLVRGFANSFDPYKREYENEWQRVFGGNIPLVRNLMPPMIDELTGKPMRNPYGNPWNANIPFEINVDEKDPVKRMIIKARYNRREVKSHMGITLSAQQRAYVRTEMFKTGRIRERLEELNGQKWFHDDIKAYRGRPFDPNGDPNTRPDFYNAISEAYSAAQTIALARLEAFDEDFKEKLRVERIRAAEFNLRNYGNKSSSQPQSNMSSLLQFNKA